MDFTAIKYSGQRSSKVNRGTIDKLLFILKPIGIYPYQMSIILLSYMLKCIIKRLYLKNVLPYISSLNLMGIKSDARKTAKDRLLGITNISATIFMCFERLENSKFKTQFCTGLHIQHSNKQDIFG